MGVVIGIRDSQLTAVAYPMRMEQFSFLIYRNDFRLFGTTLIAGGIDASPIYDIDSSLSID